MEENSFREYFNSEEKKNRLCTSRVSLIWKVKIVKTVSIYEIFYLKSKYLARNEESRIFNNILSKEPSFEVMTSYLKVFSKISQGRWKYEFEKYMF